MDDKTIKTALSYALGSDLHEVWRTSRKLKNVSDEVDIANYSFEQLPPNWQYENLEAAKVAIEQVYDKTIASEPITPEELEQMGAKIHEEWLKRNPWAYDTKYGDPKLAVPYEQLSKEEQDKDKAQIGLAQAKVQAYLDGLIDIKSICKQYGI